MRIILHNYMPNRTLDKVVVWVKSVVPNKQYMIETEDGKKFTATSAEGAERIAWREADRLGGTVAPYYTTSPSRAAHKKHGISSDGGISGVTGLRQRDAPAGQRQSFEAWMRDVEWYCQQKTGDPHHQRPCLSIYDLEDCPFRDWYDARVSASSAASRCIKRAGG